MAENEDEGGGALTAVNPPPALTGVKPDAMTGRAGSGSTDGTGVDIGPWPPWSDAFRAADARIAGELGPILPGVC